MKTKLANGKQRTFIRKAHNTKPSERGLGPDGGGWSIAQAAQWSSIGEGSLRAMAKQSIETNDPALFPCYLIGRRRILIARDGFITWFNGKSSESSLKQSVSFNRAPLLDSLTRMNKALMAVCGELDYLRATLKKGTM